MRVLVTLLLTFLLLTSPIHAGEITASTDPGPNASKTYGGVGLKWSITKGDIRVSRVLEGGPAERAGIKTDDVLTAVDGQPIDTLSEDRLVEKIQGKAGTEVILIVTREDTPHPLEFRITREDIDAKWIAHQEQRGYETELKKILPLAEQGDADAQCRLGEMYRNGQGTKQDNSEALKWYRKAADQGNSAAERAIGEFYHWGWGVEQDTSEWLRWTLLAAERGDAKAQYLLGLTFETQTEMLNYSEAFKWYKTAAKQGYRDAEFALAQMYSMGHGVKKDATEAANWLRKAADHGDNSAKTALGFRYLSGEGVPQDYPMAISILRPSAEKGDTGAQGALGKLYAEGKGVKQDYEEAYYWLSLPSKCHNNDKDVLKALDDVSKHLTPQQIFGLDKRVFAFHWPRWLGNAGAGYIRKDGTKVMHWNCGCSCSYDTPPPLIGPPAPSETPSSPVPPQR